MKYGLYQIDRPRATWVCLLIRGVVGSNPAWEFEQNEQHCCWARFQDWSVHFSWGIDDFGFSVFKSYLVSKQFKAAYDQGTDEHVREAAILSSPSCLSITGRLLDDIEAAHDANFARRIADLLVILQSKEAEGLAHTWATERSVLFGKLGYLPREVSIRWMNDDGSLAEK